MKNLVRAIIFLMLGSTASAMDGFYEASMNFDMKNVEPFLSKLEAKLNLGLDAKELGSFTRAVEVNTENTTIIETEQTKSTGLVIYHVFMDDINAPDLYFFFQDPELADKTTNFMREWAESMGL